MDPMNTDSPTSSSAL